MFPHNRLKTDAAGVRYRTMERRSAKIRARIDTEMIERTNRAQRVQFALEKYLWCIRFFNIIHEHIPLVKLRDLSDKLYDREYSKF